MDPKQIIAQFKRPLFATSLVIVAAIWGYQRHNLTEAWASLVTWLSVDNEELPPVVDSAPPPATEETGQSIAPVPTTARPRPPRAAAARTSRPRPPAARNPVMAPSLGETLDSIKPGSGPTEGSRPEQRNLYFEKLRKDLRELQGGQPKPNGPEAAEDAPPGNAPAQAPGVNPAVRGRPPGPRQQPVAEPELTSEVDVEDEVLDGEETFDGGEIDPVDPEELLELEEDFGE